jgi:4-alpha-glucanotransferase
MGFHRLFLIPEGLSASEGVYVKYHDEELFAILSLESHRHRCRLIGENLGTVPKQIERLMTKHRVGKLYVGQFQGTGKESQAMNPVPRDVAASLNTHDLPTFTLNFTGADLPERIDAGVYNPDLEPAERKNRERDRVAISAWLHDRGFTETHETDPTAVGVALYSFLAESDAELALVNIEDLWGETHWQNIPGTTTEHPNWQHKLRYTLEQIERDPALADTLEDFAARRRGERAAAPRRSSRSTGRKRAKKPASRAHR